MVDLNWDNNLKTTREYIASHALDNPSDIAVIDNDLKITYAQFHQDINRFIPAARRFGLNVGDMVAVEWTTLYPHWLLLLAFETIGVVTFTYSKNEVSEYHALLCDMDLVLAGGGVLPDDITRIHSVSQHWLDRVFSQEPEDDNQYPVFGPETPLRIHYGSATTGEPKRMVKTVQTNNFRIWQYQNKVGFDRSSRYLVSMSFCPQGMYLDATACIRMGGACIYHQSGRIFETISVHGVTHISLMPMSLPTVLDKVPKDYEKPKNLTVITVGAHVMDQLRTRTLHDFASDLIESYSTTEAGGICSIQPDGIGTILPGVHVEVVDENDTPLQGELGHVRVKSNGCIGAYENDPVATKKMFRDGWFYPGDIGILIDAHSLKLEGRADDLVNIGGMKFALNKIEDKLRRAIPLKDLGVTSLLSASGETQIWIAVELNSSTKYADIIKQRYPCLVKYRLYPPFSFSLFLFLFALHSVGDMPSFWGNTKRMWPKRTNPTCT
jgi:2,3-dihydroxybenzoate-AMP ligase